MNFECLGDTAAWGEGILPRVYVTPYEVYLWRAKLSGVDFQEPKDATYFVQAIGRKIAGFDIRGICISRAQEVSVDVIFTASSYLLNIWDNAEDITGFISQDADLRGRYPGVQVSSSALLQLTGPPASIDFWLSAPILWSNSQKAQQALSSLQSIYEGVADDGYNLKAWVLPINLGPGGGSGSSQKSSSSYTGLWILGGVIALALISARLDKK